MPENSTESFFCSCGCIAFNTSIPFSRKNKFVASAVIGKNKIKTILILNSFQIDFVFRTLTQNAIIFEHFGDVHAHFFNIQFHG